MSNEKTTLIEKTSKRLKLVRLVGILLMVVAVIVALLLSDEYGLRGWATAWAG
jgi:4-hydroxybenzoate polyprenyltransferase